MAATDVTGFGLLGHLQHLTAASGLAARVDAAAVPRFGFARTLVEQGVVPGGTRRNAGYVAPHVEYAAHVDDADRLLLNDAQTSGGLLLAVPAAREAALRQALEARDALASATIGELVASDAAGQGRIAVG